MFPAVFGTGVIGTGPSAAIVGQGEVFAVVVGLRGELIAELHDVLGERGHSSAHDTSLE